MNKAERLVENLLYFAEIDLIIKEKIGKVNDTLLRRDADKNDKDARNTMGVFGEDVADEAYYILSNKKAEVEAEMENQSTPELLKRNLILNTAQDYISDYYLCLNRDGMDQ